MLDMKYQEFLSNKAVVAIPRGINPEPVNSKLFSFQRDIVIWALRRGRAAVFADCGMGNNKRYDDFLLKGRQKKPSGKFILDPSFTEWLMGWPIGHTELNNVGMEWFHNNQSPHGKQ